jgi:lipoprotein-releasing system ATP-binding protein
MNIKAINLHKNYSKDVNTSVEVLKGISFEIPSGESVALVGPSGSGKSTLIHLLGLMDRPTKGQVLLDGIDYYALKDKDLCKMRNGSIGFMFQFHYLLSDFTVLENVLLPVWGERTLKTSKAQALLKSVGLSHRLNHYPAELSGGEQQRAALARALIADPKIIFADEPTGNLDSATGLEIEEILFAASKKNKSTLVLVTHNEALAAKADKIMRITDGKII